MTSNNVENTDATLYRAIIEADGDPVAQPRAKAFSKVVGGRAITRMYTPCGADGWKSRVWAACREKAPQAPIDAPVGVVIELWFERPKRLLGKSSPRGPVWCGAKPDIDNAEKAVLDAMSEAGIWTDDSRVSALATLKRYLAIELGGSYRGLAGARIHVLEMESPCFSPEPDFLEMLKRAAGNSEGCLSWHERRHK